MISFIGKQKLKQKDFFVFRSKLKIEWHRNGFPIDFVNEGRVSMNMMDNSLRITGSHVQDTAEYKCIASNGLDSVEVTAKLTVRGEYHGGHP